MFSLCVPNPLCRIINFNTKLENANDVEFVPIGTLAVNYLLSVAAGSTLSLWPPPSVSYAAVLD